MSYDNTLWVKKCRKLKTVGKALVLFKMLRLQIQGGGTLDTNTVLGEPGKPCDMTLLHVTYRSSIQRPEGDNSELH